MSTRPTSSTSNRNRKVRLMSSANSNATDATADAIMSNNSTSFATAQEQQLQPGMLHSDVSIALDSNFAAGNRHNSGNSHAPHRGSLPFAPNSPTNWRRDSESENNGNQNEHSDNSVFQQSGQHHLLSAETSTRAGGGGGVEDDEGAMPGASSEIELVASAVVPTFMYLVKACGTAAVAAKKKTNKSPNAAAADAEEAEDLSIASHPYLRKLQRSLFPTMALALEQVMSNPEVLREALGDAEERAQEHLSQREASSGGLKRGMSSRLKAEQLRSNPSSAASPGSSSLASGVHASVNSHHSHNNNSHHVHVHFAPQVRDNYNSSFNSTTTSVQSQQHQHSLQKKSSFASGVVSGAANLQDHTLEALAALQQQQQFQQNQLQHPVIEIELTAEEQEAIAEKKRKRLEHVKKHRWAVFQSLATALRTVRVELGV